MIYTNKRRDFIKTSTIAGLGLAVTPMMSFGKAMKEEKVRIGFIGVGGRGRSHLWNILNREDVIHAAIRQNHRTGSLAVGAAIRGRGKMHRIVR